MRFGLFTCGYQYQSIEQAFKDASAFGYSYIELWGGYPHAFAEDMDDESVQTLVSYSRKYRIPIEVYTPEHNGYPYNYVLADDLQKKRCIEYFKKCVDVTCALHAEYMLISIGHAGQQALAIAKQKTIDFIREIGEYAASKNCTLVVETLSKWESNFATSIWELQEIVEAVHLENVLGMCDVVAAVSVKEDPVQYQRVLGHKNGHIHFVDSDGVCEDHYIPLEGRLNLQKVYASFLNAGYKGRMTIELCTKYIDNPTLAFKKAMQNMKEIQKCTK